MHKCQGFNVEISVSELIQSVEHCMAKQKHYVESTIVICANMVVNSLSFLTTGVISHIVIPEVFFLS